MLKRKNELRAANNKYEFTESEEKHVTWNQGKINNKNVCLEPWKHLRIRTNGYLNVCSWRGYNENFKIQDFIKNDKVNWNDVFNGIYYKTVRKNFLNGCYKGCMHNCPAIPKGKNDV